MKRIIGLLLVSFLLGSGKGNPETEVIMSTISSPVPAWKSGDSWTIETCFIVNISQVRHGAEKLGTLCFYHIYEITGEQDIEGKNCWVIDIRATRVPDNIQNDHGNNYLWRLYLNKKDLSLVRLVVNLRRGKYLITGNEEIQRTFDFKKGNPVVIDFVPVLTPLDIPKLPSEGFPRYLSEEEKESQYLDERNKQEISQYIVAVEEKVNDRPSHVFYVTLYNKEKGIRTQKWVSGLPWWQDWHYSTNERFTTGMLYAKLIDWSGKNISQR